MDPEATEVHGGLDALGRGEEQSLEDVGEVAQVEVVVEPDRRRQKHLQHHRHNQCFIITSYNYNYSVVGQYTPEVSQSCYLCLYYLFVIIYWYNY